MTHLHIALLGPLQLTLDGKPLPAPTSAKIRSLLAYLVVEADRPHPRGELAELLWPEQPAGNARQNLRQSLTRLRRALPAPTDLAPYLKISRQTVQFNRDSGYSLDVDDFVQAMASVRQHHQDKDELCSACARRLEQAVALYRDQFLGGLHPDSLPFEEWSALKREWLRRELLQALDKLTRFHESRHNYQAAYRFAWRQVEIDPLVEEAHRQVMRALTLSGRREEALIQYETLARLLHEELSVRPAEKSTALAEAIRTGRFPQARPSSEQRSAPPLQPAAPVRLPRQFTPFVGRRQEMAAIAERLAHPHCHLLTLVGPGGVGKTRLAVEAAMKEQGHFRDGIVFVALAPVTEPEQVLTTIDSALELPFSRATQSEEARRRQLLDYLREKELLLILDNCEHVLPAAGLVMEILQAAPHVTILATSREPLHLRSEWLLDVTGLVVKAGDPRGARSAGSAVTLFEQCARRVQSTFALTEKTAPVVEQICALAAGVPLAIELAAAWARTTPLEEIASQVEANLDFLSTSMQDVPVRHRSVRASFEYSWQLLSQPERDVLAHLTVFRGGFTPVAAAAVAGATPEILDSLFKKALLQPELSTHQTDQARYDLHELLRQYATEKLASAPRLRGNAGQRHGIYFANLLAEQESRLRGPEQMQALNALRVEFDNLRRAWEWAIEHETEEIIERSLDAFAQLHLLQGLFREGATALDRAAHMLEEKLGGWSVQLLTTPAAKEHGILLAKIWARQAPFYELLALDDEQGRAILERSLAIFRHFGIHEEASEALRELSVFERKSGNFDAARQRLEESLAQAGKANNRRLRALALGEYAFLSYLQDRTQEGMRMAEASLVIHQSQGNQRGIARALSNLGLLATNSKRYDEARTYHERNLAIMRRLNHLPGIAAALNNLGLVALSDSDYPAADGYFREAQELFRELGEQYGVALALYNRGRVAQAQGAYEEAKTLHKMSLAIRQDMGRPYLCGISWQHMGYAYRALGEYAEAESCYREALAAVGQVNARLITLQILLALAELWLKTGKAEMAYVLVAFVQGQPDIDKEIAGVHVRTTAEGLAIQAKSHLQPAVWQRLHAEAQCLSLPQVVEQFGGRRSNE